MKTLVKSLLPQPARNSLVRIRDIIGLGAQPRLDFNAEPLAPVARFDPAAIWADPEIAKNWEQDSARIRKVYGDEDKLEGVNPGDRRALYYLISALKPRSVLEIGTHIGASTIHMARAIKTTGQQATVTSIDIIDVNDKQTGPWKAKGLTKPPKDYAQDLECASYIRFHKKPALEFLHQIEQSYDLIFLDGDHRAQAVYKELHGALKALRPGGLILLHDFYPNGEALYPNGITITGPFQALKRAQAENPSLTVLPLGTLPWPTKQGSHETSLAVVLKTSPKSGR